MSKVGGKLHEKLLEDTLSYFESDGWKVINLKGRSPDGIIVKDNKVVAVEILGSSYKKGKGWHSSWTKKGKQKQYSMFDDIIIKVFRRPKKPYTPIFEGGGGIISTGTSGKGDMFE